MNLEELLLLWRDLRTLHGLNGWTLTLTRSKNMAGVCRLRTKTIGLSKYHVANSKDEDVKNTLLHEIAHALTPRHGHDKTWKTKALEVGARPERCHKLRFAPSKYKVYCPNNCFPNSTRNRVKPNAVYLCVKCRQKVTIVRAGT